MPWNGSGTANVTDGVTTGRAIWTTEKAAASLITAAHFDTFSNDLCGMFQNCFTIDGQVIGNQLKLVSTVNSTTGVIYSGTNVIASFFGTGNAFGGGSGNFTMASTNCTGFGLASLLNLTSGGNNSAFGDLALTLEQTGINNTAVGYNTLSVNVGDSGNTALGSNALNALNGGSFNTVIGSGAATDMTTGGGNTLIGAGITSVQTAQKCIVIGWNNATASTSASGQINIGCTIFGTGCTATGSSAGTGKVGINNNAPTYELECGTGDFGIATAGKTLRIKEGSNAKQGTAVLVAGSKVVSTTAVTANSRIFLTSQVDGGTPGFLRVSTRTAGTSFTITSSSGTDTSTVGWLITEPY